MRNHVRMLLSYLLISRCRRFYMGQGL